MTQDIEPNPDGTPLCDDHSWELQDDSFDHEFGTERIIYWQCTDCGASKPVGPHDLDEDPDMVHYEQEALGGIHQWFTSKQ